MPLFAHVERDENDRIIEFLEVFSALPSYVICKKCRQNVTFEESGHCGIGFKIVLSCLRSRKDINSGPFVKILIKLIEELYS